ncbi:MAG: hypothetical protein ACJ8E3_09645 [Sphingomicrobium sp.]
MRRSLIVLAILGTMSAPALAQNTAVANSAQQQAKPQTVKKRVCFQAEEDSYSRLGGRKICKTVEVPVKPNGGTASDQQAPAQGSNPGK